MINDILSIFLSTFFQLYCTSYSRNESKTWLTFMATFVTLKVEMIKIRWYKNPQAQ